ncbi:hypothetical protein [Streptococcus equi]|nr:hypothetical protein [Streptococcus equi]CRS90412.1 Uncharacterised protein [Streptococcus equi subsp. equi]CRU74088.1 Uncharacterised protein [Streptococcus equi subsp. equi]CRV39906.1 Uncharacterised protein [Streptococcus equi subsp. equi]CRV40213.1 Uncharacterised protein [Streptococcus equi subsp. equi]CRV43277.1 Uncharacterised protein [Streptococcus equi subsp. equi]
MKEQTLAEWKAEGVLDGANLIADTVIKAIGQMIDPEADHG